MRRSGVEGTVGVKVGGGSRTPSFPRDGVLVAAPGRVTGNRLDVPHPTIHPRQTKIEIINHSLLLVLPHH